MSSFLQTETNFGELVKDYSKFDMAAIADSKIFNDFELEIPQSSDFSLNAVLHVLLEHLKKSVSDKVALTDTLLKMLRDEMVNDAKGDFCSVVHRCGCALYTLFYTYMLEINNLTRYPRHQPLIDPIAQASFRRKLQNYSLKEAVEAIQLLEEILAAIADNSSTTLLFGNQCVWSHNRLKDFTEEQSISVKEKVLASFPDKLVVEGLLLSTRKLNTSSKDESQNRFSLLTTAGNSRKPILKRKLAFVSENTQTLRKSDRTCSEANVVKKKNFEEPNNTELSEETSSSDTDSDYSSYMELDLDDNGTIDSVLDQKNASFFKIAPSHDWLDGATQHMKVNYCVNLLFSFERNRLVVFRLKDFLSNDLLAHAHRVLKAKAALTRSSLHLPVGIRNNYRKTTTSKRIVNDDGKRVAYTVSYDGGDEISGGEFSILIEWIINLVKLIGDGRVVSTDAHPCASDGSANKLHLIVGLPLCLPQHFHYDYDPKSFQYDGYHGASLFINFSLHSQTLDVGVCEHDPSKRKQKVIPPLSVLVIRGDLKHAGSSNISDMDEVHKFFMYLDPYDVKMGNFRKLNSNTLYYDEYDDLSFILSSAERKTLLEEEKIKDLA
jgi:hypothetical protein